MKKTRYTKSPIIRVLNETESKSQWMEKAIDGQRVYRTALAESEI